MALYSIYDLETKGPIIFNYISHTIFLIPLNTYDLKLFN